MLITRAHASEIVLCPMSVLLPLRKISRDMVELEGETVAGLVKYSVFVTDCL